MLKQLSNKNKESYHIDSLKVLSIIKSCDKLQHLEAAGNLIGRFHELYVGIKIDKLVSIKAVFFVHNQHKEALSNQLNKINKKLRKRATTLDDTTNADRHCNN